MKHKLTVTEHIRKTHEIEVSHKTDSKEYIDSALDYVQDIADDIDEYKEILSDFGFNIVNHEEKIDEDSLDCLYADEI